MPNKSLGQHWLKDRLILEAIADCAELSKTDTVLEIGPGLGTLTSVLLGRVATVVAVEYDAELARKLPGQFPGTQLRVVQADFLHFDTSSLPQGYKVVANVPYYITTKILQHLTEGKNLPQTIVILVQREVAEKYAAAAGSMNAGAVLLQNHYNVRLGIRVPKMYFTPPPDVDSQVLVCTKRDVPIIAYSANDRFHRMVQAGFSAPRKKLRSSLSGGLGISVADAELLLENAAIDPHKRAQDLSVIDWSRL